MFVLDFFFFFIGGLGEKQLKSVSKEHKSEKNKSEKIGARE